ncbi:SDR family NAD(P)-dependent oxidoreductase [Rhodovibrionaceae bacterium A322]
MEQDLTGKVALVTGAGGAIGAAICRFLADQGAKIAACDLAAESLSDLCASLPTDSLAVSMDVADQAAVAAGVARVRADLGQVDILVNCAGILSNNKLMDTSAEEWRRIHAVNLDGPFYLSQEVLPAMKAAGWGRIINIISYAWKSGGKTSGTAYSASKGGLVGLTFTIAKEAAEFGVTVNGIAPAYVMSPMVTEQLSESQRQAQLEAIPVRRFSQPEEVAHAVRFLASPLAAFITGEVVDMNGGFQFD